MRIMREINGQCLRLENNDKISIYEELTDKAGPVLIHQRNIWVLVVVLFKIKNCGPSKLGTEIFVGETESHDLRQSNDWFVRALSFRSISISIPM